jgi:putative membrane protein
MLRRVRRRRLLPQRDLRGIGEEVDYRFSLANERTLLAHLRTALALMAAGIALLHVSDGALDVVAGVVLVLTGVAEAALSYPRWWRTEAAMRRSEPLPFSRLTVVVAGTLAVAGLVVAAGRLL